MRKATKTTTAPAKKISGKAPAPATTTKATGKKPAVVVPTKKPSSK